MGKNENLAENAPSLTGANMAKKCPGNREKGRKIGKFLENPCLAIFGLFLGWFSQRVRVRTGVPGGDVWGRVQGGGGGGRVGFPVANKGEGEGGGESGG